jgi:hypothetical protein
LPFDQQGKKTALKLLPNNPAAWFLANAFLPRGEYLLSPNGFELISGSLGGIRLISNEPKTSSNNDVSLKTSQILSINPDIHRNKILGIAEFGTSGFSAPAAMSNEFFD